MAANSTSMYDSNGDAGWERLGSQDHLDHSGTPGNEQAVVKVLRRSFNEGLTFPVAFRKQQLRQLQKFLTENENELVDSLFHDLHKHRNEAMATEILILQEEIQFFLDNLDELLKPKNASSGILAFALNKLYIVKEPLGVVLVIGAWNYPVQVSLMPLIGAIAAGNCVVVKPSEIASATANALKKLENYLDRRCYRVAVGGPDTVTNLMTEKFDHVVFTGSTRVGQIIYEQAAKQLTPVTLELGGKSPCFVDAQCDLHIVANRIMWGKITNSGQTCVAPDYVFVDARVRDQFIEECSKTLKDFYSSKRDGGSGGGVKTSTNYCRMINDKQFERVKAFIDAAQQDSKNAGRVVLGGETDAAERFIAPTLLADVPLSAPILQEEIFGPVLPILSYTQLDEAIAQSKQICPKPLALYAFSNSDRYLKHIEQNTTSGGLLFNDTVLHLVPDTLPFGGVGTSGIGRYHGLALLETFSNNKSVMKSKLSMESFMSLRYPPYTPEKLARGKSMMRRLPGTEPRHKGFGGLLKSLPLFIAGIIATFVAQGIARWYGGGDGSALSNGGGRGWSGYSAGKHY